MNEEPTTFGKFALILSPRGIDNIIFLASERKESMAFYLSIESELRKFEKSITLLARGKEERGQNGIERAD